jgi:hypothetical protein
LNFTQSYSTTPDFFADLYETRASKIAIMLISGVIAPINVILLYSIIWFEHYGVDLKRTLINKAIATMCWNGLMFETVLYALNIVQFIFGLLPFAVCLIKTAGTYTCNMIALLFVDISLITRYLYIFILKNSFAFQDDFW